MTKIHTLTKRANFEVLTAGAIAGLVLGFIGGPVQILLVWGLVGTCLGFFSPNYRTSGRNGAVYGFVVSFCFMLRGYAGSDPVASKLLPFALIGVFGACCGLICCLLGRFLRHRLKNADTGSNS